MVSFRELLIKNRKANIKIFYNDNTTKEAVWNAKNIKSTTNISANIRSRKEFRQGVWQENNIRKLEVIVAF